MSSVLLPTSLEKGYDKRANVSEQNACYYKRDESGAMVGYKRGTSGTEILCGAAK